MAYEVSCDHCSARFSLALDLYARKIKGRITTIRCLRCGREIVVDDTKLEAPSGNLKLRDEPDPKSVEPISERRIFDAKAVVQEPVTPRVNKIEPSVATKPKPPPVPKKAGESLPKTLWVVSYAEHDDRELTGAQLRSALVRGEINRNTLVWQEGMSEWRPLWKIPELSAILPKPGDVLLHRLPGEKNPRRPISHPPPKPERRVPPPPAPSSLPTFGRVSLAHPPPPADLVVRTSDKPKTRPDLPKARVKARGEAPQEAPPDAAERDETPPPISSIPALSSLTQKHAGAAVSSNQDFFLGFQSNDPGLLAPPSLEQAPPPPSEPPAVVAAPIARPDVERSVAKPISEPSNPEKKSVSPLVWLLSGAVLLALGWWLIFHPPWSRSIDASEAAHSVDLARPAALPPPASAPAASPVAREEPVAPEPSASASVATSKQEPPRATEPPPSKVTRAKSTAAAAPESKPTPAPAAKPAPPSEPAEAAEPAEPAVQAPFDKGAALAALNSAAAAAGSCRTENDPTGVATVIVTFASSGRVTNATVSGPPFAGTATGGCVARMLRRAKVPPFNGEHVTVSKTVLLQ